MRVLVKQESELLDILLMFLILDALQLLTQFTHKVQYTATWEEAGLGMVWQQITASIAESVIIILPMKRYPCQQILEISLEWSNSHHFQLKRS